MNNKVVSSKTTSAIFLAIVLVTGTIAAIYPSFIVGTAQAQPYYGGGMDNDYQKSYGKDDKRDQSKDSKSVDIKKIKCINTNLNINGNNTGNVGIGNKGTAEEGYLGAYSSDGSGGYGGGGYDGFKKDKGFECIINNNNNNTNVVEAPPPVEDECPEADEIESCFRQFLSAEQFSALEAALKSQAGLTVEIAGEDVTLRSFTDICLALEGLTFEQLFDAVAEIIQALVPPGTAVRIPVNLITCIAEALGIPVTPA